MSASLEKLLRDARIDLILIRIEKDPSVIEEVIEHLDSKIRSIRFNSILILGKLGELSSSALSKLISCLEDNDWSICRESVRSLGNLGNIAEEATSGLCRLNESDETSIRKEIAIALGKIGFASEEVISCLSSVLKDPDKEIRIEAAQSLGKLGSDSPKIISSLIESLSDQNWRVRSAAVASLGNIGKRSNEVISNLINTLGDNDWRVRNRSINSLVSLGENVIPLVLETLDNRNTDVRTAAIEILGELKNSDPKVLKNLSKFLKSRKEIIRGKTIYSLRNIGEPSIPYFISAIESSRNQRRINLISGIGGIEDNLRDSIPNLAQIFETCGILKSKIKILEFRKSISLKEKIQYLIRKVGRMLYSFIIDPFSIKAKIRLEISRALGKMGKNSDFAVSLLIDALSDFKKQVRKGTALALGDLGSSASASIPKLIELLNDPVADVRWRASEALGKIGIETPEVISGLEDLLYDRFDHVSVSAEFALDTLKTRI